MWVCGCPLKMRINDCSRDLAFLDTVLNEKEAAGMSVGCQTVPFMRRRGSNNYSSAIKDSLSHGYSSRYNDNDGNDSLYSCPRGNSCSRRRRRVSCARRRQHVGDRCAQQ